MGQLNLSINDEPTIILCPATPRGAIEALEQWLQEQMPPCWKITCLFKLHGEHHQLTGYELQVGFDVFTIGAEGQSEPPPGWTVKVIGGASYNEFIITAPDGTEALISDILLA
jgi:hypothetical protein